MPLTVEQEFDVRAMIVNLFPRDRHDDILTLDHKKLHQLIYHESAFMSYVETMLENAKKPIQKAAEKTPMRKPAKTTSSRKAAKRPAAKTTSIQKSMKKIPIRKPAKKSPRAAAKNPIQLLEAQLKKLGIRCSGPAQQELVNAFSGKRTMAHRAVVAAHSYLLEPPTFPDLPSRAANISLLPGFIKAEREYHKVKDLAEKHIIKYDRSLYYDFFD